LQRHRRGDPLVCVELLSRLHYRAGVPKSEGWLRVRFDGKALVLKGNNKFDEIVTEVGGRRQRAGFAVGWRHIEAAGEGIGDDRHTAGG
jgi:hypothetical protein